MKQLLFILVQILGLHNITIIIFLGVLAKLDLQVETVKKTLMNAPSLHVIMEHARIR